MSKVNYTNGVLVLDGELPSGNKISVKPDATGTLLWGLVNDFHYSMVVSGIQTVIIVGNHTVDTINIDPNVKATVTLVDHSVTNTDPVLGNYYTTLNVIRERLLP